MEQLHFILWGCVGEGIRDSNRIVGQEKNRKPLKEEVALVVV